MSWQENDKTCVHMPGSQYREETAHSFHDALAIMNQLYREGWDVFEMSLIEDGEDHIRTISASRLLRPVPLAVPRLCRHSKG